MIDDLGEVRTRLVEPAPPATLKATVMARIAREADRASSAAAAEGVPVRRRHDGPVWLGAAAGLAIVLGASAYAGAYGWFETGALPDFTSPRTAGNLALIPTEPVALVVGLGLLVYLAGLLAPLGSGERR